MGRKKARRPQREPHPTNPVKSMKVYTDEDADRQRQDFTAGTVFAAGAMLVTPNSNPNLPPLFMVVVDDGPATFGPAPNLRALLRLLDEHGSVHLSDTSTIGTSWALFDDPDSPLVKLKIEVHEPADAAGRFEVLLVAPNYAGMWQHIADGGLVGITTSSRQRRLIKNPDATYADAAETCVVAGIGASPALHHMIRAHDWPHDLLDTSQTTSAPAQTKPTRTLVELPTDAPGPAVRALMVDPQTKTTLGHDGLVDIAAHLWAVDCQTCGRPLQTQPPALVIHDLPGLAIASLHHDHCAPVTTGPIRNAPAPFHRHNSWTARSMLMPLMHGDVQEDHAALLVNPGLENVAVGHDTAGRWRAEVAADFRHLNLVPPGNDFLIGKPTPGAEARIVGSTIALDTTAPRSPVQMIYDAPADPPVLAAARKRGGVILLATHSLWFDSDRVQDDLNAVFHTDRIRLGWIALA